MPKKSYTITKTTINDYINKLPKYAKIFTSLLISKKEDIKYAIDNAFGSMVFLAQGSQRKNFAVFKINTTVVSILGDLLNEIYDYFNTSKIIVKKKSDFFSFHETLCKKVLAMNSVRSSMGISDLTYGNAQKLINIIFKYLTCYDDYPKFKSKFDYCHMPIDSYILRYFDVIARIGKVTSFVNKKGQIIAKYDGAPWSSLSEELYKELYDSYYAYFDMYYLGYSMLELEYYIWPSVAANRISPARI